MINWNMDIDTFMLSFPVEFKRVYSEFKKDKKDLIDKIFGDDSIHEMEKFCMFKIHWYNEILKLNLVKEPVTVEKQIKFALINLCLEKINGVLIKCELIEAVNRYILEKYPELNLVKALKSFKLF